MKMGDMGMWEQPEPMQDETVVVYVGGWDGKGQHVEEGRAETDRTLLQRQAYTATDGNLPLRQAALHTAGSTGAAADPSRFSCSRT